MSAPTIAEIIGDARSLHRASVLLRVDAQAVAGYSIPAGDALAADTAVLAESLRLFIGKLEAFELGHVIESIDAGIPPTDPTPGLSTWGKEGA
ncbi:MAG TPA: hypothetical protein VFU90_07775 [Candidatus Tumulicola sp.]|nr:hypothetical protein [Candidatus Tumulicola sp.]